MKLTFFGYLIFIIACIIFSLYVHFPGKSAAEYIENRISQLDPAVKIQIDPIVPCLPLGMKTSAVTIGYGGTSTMTMENFRSFPDFTTLFASVVNADFKTSVFGGFLSGRVGISRQNPGDLTIETRGESLQLDRIELGKLLLDCQVSGRMDLNVTAAFKDGLIRTNHGEINLADLGLHFPAPLFSIETYSFSTGKIKFDMTDDHVVKIQDFIMKGRQTDIQLTGKIQINPEVKKSLLEMKAKIVLYPLFFMNAGDAAPIDVAKNSSDNTVVHLNVGGTIETPLIAMDHGTK